jgi:hypothetical protein
LYVRAPCGKVVIVADRPGVVLAALRKQWLVLTRKVQRECASTLNAVKIFELRRTIAHMQMLRFATEWPMDNPADVHIVMIEQLLEWAPECRTLYITCDVESEQLHMVTSWMPYGGLVVVCKLHPSCRT